MKGIFTVITFEIVLVAIVGVLTSLISESLSIEITTVWIVLGIVLLVLIPTSWLRHMYESGKKDLSFGIKMPDTINFSVSLASMKENLSLISTIIINGILVGLLSGYVSVSLARGNFFSSVTSGTQFWLYSFIDIGVYEHEIIGVSIIALAVLVVMRRLSFFLGLVFCVASSLPFSFTHVSLISNQNLGWTLIGNFLCILLLSILLRIVYPLLTKLILNFWRKIFTGGTT